MSEVQLFSIGDTTYDTFMSPREMETLCRLDKHECYVAFSFGEKIPVSNLEFSVGGNAANNAVGVSRLGVKVGLVSTFGDDDVSEQIKKHLLEEKVNLTYSRVQDGSGSNFSTIINYGGERTIFTYRPVREYVFPKDLPGSAWAYLTSMAENFERYYEEVVGWVKKYDVKLAFNPGSRQVRAGVERIKNVLSVTHVLYVNRNEAERLTGFGDSRGKDKELLAAVCALGPKMSIVTDGNLGSLAYDGKKFYKAGVLPVDAFERTGAGDGFGSGCVAALIYGKSFKEALLWGTINGASVIGYVGSQKGLLTRDRMPEWLERVESCNVEVEEI